jgi:DNA-binding beta-propeller fold protein YncE
MIEKNFGRLREFAGRRRLGVSPNNAPKKIRNQRGENDMKNYRIHAGPLRLALCGAGFATPRAAVRVNMNQIAIRKWHGANRTTSFAVQNRPACVASDGANVWVANFGSNTVAKVRPSDGAILGTYAVGTSPQGLAFDGANTWVANVNSANVTRLRASNGATVGTCPGGNNPQFVAWDGANIWVRNLVSNTLIKLQASTGAVLATYSVTG